MADAAGGDLFIAEEYISIQGETTRMGEACYFIRLAGCNLHCVWCDTRYAAEMDGDAIPFRRLAGRVFDSGVELVSITGGEPLLQAPVADLARLLLENGHAVMVETNGSLPVCRLPGGVSVILDIKCPGSGMADHNRWENLDWLKQERDEVKFIITGREDYEWSRAVVDTYNLSRRCRAVHFSPAAGQLEAAQLAQWILDDVLPVRLQIQLHRILWPERTRGV
jgi:7-carboxy-7-deazaguanine synthase